MKLVVAVRFEGGGAVVAGVAFDGWGDAEPVRTGTTHIAQVEKPVRGELDLRAVPAVLQLLREHPFQPELVVFDGAVHRDATEAPALGHHLFHALGGVPVVGLSKAAPPDHPGQHAVHREEEGAPLYVSSLGLDLGAAKARVRLMHGKRSLPTLVKLAARLAKGGAG